MEIVVVFESIFGSTKRIAEAIAEGAQGGHPRAHIAVRRITETDLLAVSRADLIIVGGPTHTWGMSRPRTRRHAVLSATREQRRRDVQPGAEGPGVREWLGQLPSASGPRRAAAFDTRSRSLFARGAARSINRALVRHGYGLVMEPQGFRVEGPRGPLMSGEVERARLWGARLVEAVMSPTPGPLCPAQQEKSSAGPENRRRERARTV